MKISLKELRSNPFQDPTLYPVHRKKVEALKASIRATGFWDNVLVRKSGNGEHYEMAYGHHRLVALKELVREKLLDPEFQVDVAVRKLDDAAMLRIMANENADEYKATPEIVDETVRVAREYLQQQTKTPANQISASDIAQFLGGNWTEARAGLALQRLGLFDRGTLRREQLKGLPPAASRGVQREVGRVEKTMLKSEMGALEENDEEATEQDRKRVRAQVQKAASHVAQVLSDHLRGGGSTADIKEKSIEAQAETLPEDAGGDARRLSTIDAAAQGVNPREFQRKVELLMRYRQYMSAEAQNALKARLQDLSGWCRQMMEQLG
ncbi:MAG: ParB/RepB/Spo0J family partition protein [Planctomycetota bacterium]